jgi:fibro-slime domain-containing protein
MRICRATLLAAVLLFAATTAHAGLLGMYYNLSASHPDMETPITGVKTGWVENTLTGSSPTLTTEGANYVNQFDWWDNAYYVGQRVDSDADLQSNFANSWFPLNQGITGDPYHFAVRWTGSFYVASDMTYTYSMGSDDDSWLFIDKQLELDLGGIHAKSYTNYNVDLSAGWHSIDIFFAERHVVQSGFQLNFFSDLHPTAPVPEPGTLMLVGIGLAGAGFLRRRKAKR